MTGEVQGYSANFCVGPVGQGRAPVPINSSLQRFRTTRTEYGNSDFPWNLQQRITKKGLAIAIEPNETSHDSVTFVVPSYCTAVQIRLFIPTKRKNDMGWTAVIYHDTQPTS